MGAAGLACGMNNALRPLFVPALLTAGVANAQIVLGPADMLEAGDTVRYATAGTTDADLGVTGPAFTWDFGSLVPMGEGADTAVTVGSTPFLYQFYFNNPFLYPEHVADFALRGQAFDFQAISIQDVYDYHRTDNDGFRNVGFGANINGIPASVQREPVDVVYPFPLAYGGQNTSSSEYHITVPGLGHFGQEQTRDNEVDGWGTLYLPADTFEVLRVTSRLQRTDTIYVDQFGVGFSVPEPESIEYKWLAQGRDEPVLQVTTIGGVPTFIRFYYMLDDVPTGIVDALPATAPSIWPNPAHGMLHLLTDGRAGTLEVLGMDGRVVRTVAIAAGIRDHVEDVSALAPGTYAVRRMGGTAVERFVIAH